ncbi:MAG TPA: hypothetical protein VM187_15150, partial [Niastella sp.]|nr:hypothetical protein [Niastella sp.]
MNRYTPIMGAIASGLCLCIAMQHTLFFLAWLALVPVFIPLFNPSACSPFRAGVIMGATLSCFAFYWMIAGIPAFTGLAAGY